MPRRVDKPAFFAAVADHFGNIESITRDQLYEFCAATGADFPHWFCNDLTYRLGRGIYSLNSGNKTVKPKAAVSHETHHAKPEPVEEFAVAALTPSVQTAEALRLIPQKQSGYVPFGNFNDVRSIVKSSKFYPVYITGLSGNGKTTMVEQVCAAEKRECIRVNITIETDEDDLIGGFRLIDGHTVWQDGPVIAAMTRGAVLLIDEIDLASNKIMCLQPVLEGKGIFLKKVGRLVKPEHGFNVIATANTKGKGSDDGRFIGTNVLNEAFLERFSITMEQEYPGTKTETKILTNVLSANGVTNKEFVEKLVTWADVIRKSFFDGALSEIISTRRLVHICEAYSIFNENRVKAIELCLNRFDIDTKNAFMELYKKVDETIEPEVPSTTGDPEEEVAI